MMQFVSRKPEREESYDLDLNLDGEKKKMNVWVCHAKIMRSLHTMISIDAKCFNLISQLFSLQVVQGMAEIPPTS